MACDCPCSRRYGPLKPPPLEDIDYEREAQKIIAAVEEQRRALAPLQAPATPMCTCRPGIDDVDDEWPDHAAGCPLAVPVTPDELLPAHPNQGEGP